MRWDHISASMRSSSCFCIMHLINISPRVIYYVFFWSKANKPFDPGFWLRVSSFDIIIMIMTGDERWENHGRWKGIKGSYYVCTYVCTSVRVYPISYRDPDSWIVKMKTTVIKGRGKPWGYQELSVVRLMFRGRLIRTIVEKSLETKIQWKPSEMRDDWETFSTPFTPWHDNKWTSNQRGQPTSHKLWSPK